jgi:AcrR family transcriptional regulator
MHVSNESSNQTIMNRAPARKAKRRSQEQRSSATKKRLMESAIRLLCEKGYANLTMLDVARKTGVSRGAPLHHYSNKPKLVAAVVEYSCKLAETTAAALAHDVDAAQDPLDAFVDGMAEYFFSPLFLAQTEILIAARTDPDIGALMRRRLTAYRVVAERAWTEALRRSGFSAQDAFWIFQLTLNVLRGLGFHHTWKPEPQLMAKCVAAWKKVLRQLLDNRALSRLPAGR